MKLSSKGYPHTAYSEGYPKRRENSLINESKDTNNKLPTPIPRGTNAQNTNAILFLIPFILKKKKGSRNKGKSLIRIPMPINNAQKSSFLCNHPKGVSFTERNA